MTTTPDTLPRTDVLAAVRAAWYEAARDKHGNPIIALTTVLRGLGMGEHVTVKDGRAVLVEATPTKTSSARARADAEIGRVLAGRAIAGTTPPEDD